MMAAMQVVDPSAAMSKVVPGCCALNCSANCGTNLAPSVSEPLMTRRSAFALDMAAVSSARLIAKYLIFIGYGGFGCCVLKSCSLELQVHVSLKDLILVDRIDWVCANPAGRDISITPR